MTPIARAFVLITVELGKKNPVLDRLRRMAVVKESYVTFGLYDIICMVETEMMEEAGKAFTEEIRKLPGIRTTLTMMVVS